MMRNTKQMTVLALLAVAGLVACESEVAPVSTDNEPVVAPIPQPIPEATAQRVVDAFERNFGVHPGLRRNHTKGICASGQFIGEPEAQTWSRSALFSGEPVPVIARFSLPGGNPAAADAGPTPRGMALEFRLADGGLQHMTLLNVPVFSAATPQSFYEGLLAAELDPTTGKPDPARVQAYRDSHPDTAALVQFMQAYRPPVSYATSAYFGIHAFAAINAGGTMTPVKWHFVPEDGEQSLDSTQMADRPADFLADALVNRAGQGPIRWQMWLTLGEPDDPTNNPTLAWPEDRRQVLAGTLSLDAVAERAGEACQGINFDPLVMADGLQPSDDPILAFRSGAYAVSFAKRLRESSQVQTETQ